jgi:hypothetical protein
MENISKGLEKLQKLQKTLTSIILEPEKVENHYLKRKQCQMGLLYE